MPRLVSICATLALLLAAPGVAHGRILYVGDSLGAGTLPQLRSMMPGAALDGDTRVGRSSPEGLAVLRSRLRRGDRVVIFDLGSNDSRPATLRSTLRRARGLTGDRPMIVFTLNRPDVRPFNRVLRAFAAAARNVVLIDWHRAAGREGLLAGDGVHAAGRGYRRRAELVAARIARRIPLRAGRAAPGRW